MLSLAFLTAIQVRKDFLNNYSALGPEVANYVSKNVVKLLKSLESYMAKDYEAALKEVFFKMDDQMRPLVESELL